MTEQDRERFGAAIGALAEAVGESLGATRLEAYFKSLLDFPIEQIEGYCTEGLTKLRWFPKIPEIREALGGQYAVEDEAQIAWQLFLDATAKGYWSSVYFADPCIIAAIRYTFGGWVQACAQLRELGPEMQKSRQKDFAINYRLAKRLPSRQQEHYLEGHCEQNNRGTIGKGIGVLPKFQPVIVANAAGYAVVTVVQMQIDPKTGAIADSARQMLSNPYQVENVKQLQSNERQCLLLEASIPEPASEESRQMQPEEIQRAVRDFIAGTRITPPTAKPKSNLDSHTAGLELTAKQ